MELRGDDLLGLETPYTCIQTTQRPISPFCILDYSVSHRLTLHNRFENSEFKALTPSEDAPSKTHSTLKRITDST